MEKRALVIEYRFRKPLSLDGNTYWVRFWVEHDLRHGGTSREEAAVAISRAMDEAYKMQLPVQDTAEILLFSVAGANSVEVCSCSGDEGVAVHRDWP